MSGGEREQDVLSIKDMDDIEMVKQRINQVKEIKRSVQNLKNQGDEFEHIKKAADEILGQLNEGHNEIKEKKDLIQKLDQAVKQLETQPKRSYKQLTTLDTALLELEQQKAILRKRLSSLEKLNLTIDVLSYKIYEVQHDYTTDMETLREEKEELLARKDLSEEDLNALLSEVDKRIQDRQVLHIAATANLETQKTTLEKQSVTKIHDLDKKIEELKRRRSIALLELEDQKLNATPSELEKIGEEINKVNVKYEEEINDLRKLQGQGWTDTSSEEQLVAALKEKGLKITKSGKLLTKTGKLLTIEEAEAMGLLDDLDLPWDKIKSGFCSVELRREEADEAVDESEEASEGSMYTQMTSEDVSYLKDTLGKPLTLAMAEVLMKQPRDPIHYLGHWLFKYRYNQEVEDSAKQEISELVVERARVAKERWQAEVQEEAQRAVLNLIVRVEEEILRRELERAAQRQRDEEEGIDEYGQAYN